MTLEVSNNTVLERIEARLEDMGRSIEDMGRSIEDMGRSIDFLVVVVVVIAIAIVIAIASNFFLACLLHCKLKKDRKEIVEEMKQDFGAACWLIQKASDNAIKSTIKVLKKGVPKGKQGEIANHLSPE